MNGLIKKSMAVLMSVMMFCTVAPTSVSAKGNVVWGEETNPGEIDTEPEVTESEETVSAEENNTEEQLTEETEAVEEEIVSEETAAPGETIIPEETEAPEETVVPETVEESTVAEDKETTSPEEVVAEPEETAEPEEVSLITLDPVSYNGLTISVSYDSDAFGGKKVEMKVSDPGETETAALTDLGQFKAVDITFIDEEGNPVQPEEDKTVSVVLKADEMENADNAELVHVDGNGNISFLNADITTSNPVTKTVKTGETTTTVTVPEETKKVLVKDYKDESYTVFEVQKRTVEVPEIIAYRYVLKSKVVRTAAPYKGVGKKASRTVERVQYYLEKEPYVLRPAYTKTVNVKVPVTKTRKVLVGSHYETKVVKEAYTYEKTEDVYEDVTYSDVEASFAADSFSVYAIVVVNTDGGIDFDESFGPDHITVNAPAGAFEEGTVMKIESVDDPDVLANALKVLNDNQTYSFNAVNISFWQGDQEVEPQKPVKVTWTSDYIKAGDKLVHINDDGTAELIGNALVKDTKTVFTADQFSTYTTARLDTFELGTQVVFTPTELNDGSVTTMKSGDLSETHPEFDGYTYINATYQKAGQSESEDPVIYLGAFIYREFDDEGEQIGTDKKYIYYRTESTAGDSDLIVRLAEDETIHLNYKETPFNVTYRVIYNGSTYIIGQHELPSELADLVFTGPDTVARNTSYENAVQVSLPRGYSATVQMSNKSGNQEPLLGEGSEPNYTCTDGWTVRPDDYPFTIDGLYTISNVNADLTVTLNVTKRNSYRFTAQPAFDTAYFGGTSTARYQSVNPRNTYTFNGNTTEFSFVTRNSTNIQWALDSLNINKESVLVPFVDSSNRNDSATTTLTSGTVITVSAEYINSGNYRGNRQYTISVSNCYENISITGGNLHNVVDKPEWVLQERENLSEFDYGSSSYLPLVAGEPMTYDGWQNYATNNAAWRAWNNETMAFTPRTIRFKVAEGYVNPQIKYITPEGRDDYARVGDVTLASEAKDFYHLITSEPDADGYYYFSLKGNSSSTYMGLLSAKAELARYGVSYDAGEVSGATVPDFDEGGRYGDESLRGYNIIDNQYVVLAKSAPVDENKNYVFQYYKIDGDNSTKTYAPSQKIPLSEIAEFGVYDEEKGEYVIPFVAYWEKKETSELVPITAYIYLDDELEDTVVTSVPENSAVYIDIDSETMNEVMDKYNWQLFYDETDSDPFIEKVQKDDNNEVSLYLYSKFYVYHSATGKLELHTTKELETIDGDSRTIGNLNITGLTNSGSLYGGYYMDYQGAHVGGTNVVKDAADDHNNNGTLSTSDIVALSNGQAVEIGTYGTTYDPASNADHVGYWSDDDAFTASLTTPSADWYSDRGSKDTAVLQTGGNGTDVKVARAGIYYLKEVPNSYLRPTHMTTYQRYDKYLRDFILFSTTDDTNYSTSGFLIGSTYTEKEVFTDQLTINFGPNYDETVTDGKVDVDVTNTSSNAGGYVMAYRLFHLADESNKDYSSIIGNKSFKPYWVTLDGITVTGASTRRETVKDVDSDGVIKVDPVDGEELKEITYRDIAARINAFKQ